MQNKAKGTTLPDSAQGIVNNISEWSKDAYSKLKRRDKRYTELMYVAADYGNVTLITDSIIFTKHILVKMESPKFDPKLCKDFVALGYAKDFPPHLIRKYRDDTLNYGLESSGRQFQVGVSVAHFGEELSKLASNDSVGGLFSVGIITSRGVQWSQYSYGHRVELKIEGGKFIQYDLENGRRVPLKTLIEFDVRKPDSGNTMFKTPGTE